ncbi:MAG TPA: glycosyltransferase family 39 protein [Bacteroidota bacterium]|nr:glycosyltransferase family 39 protein [Bacteroidota bacterium]
MPGIHEEKDDERRQASAVSGRSYGTLLAFLILIVAIGAGVVLHHQDRYSLYYFGDASSHVIKAREFTDGLGIQELTIGTTWLPLPHLLLLPFTSIDLLFFSGVAGMFVGIPCLVGTGIILFLLIKDLTSSPWIAFLMSAVVSLNPNIVYMALTPMDEASLTFFVALAGFGVYRWLQNGSLPMLLLTSVSVVFATLCRYEAWLLAPLLFFAAALEGIAHWRRGEKGRGTKIILIAAIAGAGILFWVGWHFLAFGNPLKFARGTYSALPDYYRNSEQRLPAKIAKTYLTALLNIFGPFLLCFALIFWRGVRMQQKRKPILFLLLFFLAPLAFTVVATFAGYVGIDQWWWNWRYVLTFGLFLAVAGGLGLKRIAATVPGIVSGVIASCLLIAMPITQLTTPSVSVATYRDAAKCITPTIKDAMLFGGMIPRYYREGSIALLTEASSADRIKIASWVPMLTFHSIPFPPGCQVPDSVLRGDRYIVMEKNRAREPWTTPPNSQLLPDVYPRHFEVIAQDSCFCLMERSPDRSRSIYSALKPAPLSGDQPQSPRAIAASR